MQPSKAIRSTINQLIPRYGKVKSERCFGETHSPIQALQEKQGNCIHRTSLAAALAEVNNLPYQIVGSRNLLPEIHGTADLLTHFAPNYLIPRLSREPRQIRSFLCDLFINVIYGLTYPHWWLEVWENDRWATVDTVEWQPTSLPYFRENVEKRMVCKMGRIEQLSPQLK